jgi:hypothetical protein
VEIAGLNSIIDSGVTETMVQDTQVIFFANVLLYLGASSESLRDVSFCHILENHCHWS